MPDRERARVFGEEALRYDRARPGYPDELVADLAASGRRVLDIGCGTGIAARLFQARGCEVLGVEPDARMAEVAASRGLDVDVATFEDWEPRRAPFDLVIAAQAWHWLDKEQSLAKVVDVLRPAGRFAAFWNGYALDPATRDVLFPVYERHAPTFLQDSVVLGTVPPMRDGDLVLLRSRDDLTAVESRSYEWSATYTTDEWLDQLATHSDHRVLDPAVFGAIVTGTRDALGTLGDRITVSYSTGVATALRA